MAGFQQ